MIIADAKMERMIKLKSLNPHISCKICKGYLIDATTVTECLHTFCKSCLVKHLEEHNTCPTCDIVIHQSHPLNYISYDRTMQDIVYKLVTNLQQNEIKREKDFYKKKNLPYPKANVGISNEKETIASKCVDVIPANGCETSIKKEQNADFHRFDEQINLELESQMGNGVKPIKLNFVRCSAHATVTHIKKFVAFKLFNSFDKYKDIDILCDGDLLGKDHTLKFVSVTKWRLKEPPIKLCYRPRLMDF